MRLQKPDWEQGDQHPGDLQKAVAQLVEQIAKRDQKIARQESLLLYTQAQLAEGEAQLAKITTSRVWKVTRPIRWIGYFLAAPGSARGSMLRRGWEMILSSLKKTGRN